MNEINTPVHEHAWDPYLVVDAGNHQIPARRIAKALNGAARREARLLEDLDSMGRRLADMSIHLDMLLRIYVHTAQYLNLKNNKVLQPQPWIDHADLQLSEAMKSYAAWLEQR